ncbi:siderophore ABC transporter substrate-binding protein [Brevibacillus composti]|uniref:Siderophore ABC transporter substrate-binding protein n=1 Tax=Brevibacillus composti TaxID=2796470 RepID=A0A7T5ELF8_9BACL|nr:siderophore ABC transporter substrate-binding protein [Brevibacillus composti]QQE74748.1 siderophore ABC transporter substrate-binding protein [Brevibacillus composti]QUO41832.1 siderophore ABC transporter substrate-binding protein [Brevibacillus composti]
MKKLALLFMIAVLAVFAAACGSSSSSTTGGTNASAGQPQAEAPQGAQTPAAAEELTIKHELGETKVKKNPQKVVVFDFGTLDTLEKLGVEVAALPKTSIPKYLEKFKDDKYANVGSLKEPDFEKINEIKPDLIIISGRQSAMYEEFQKIAPTIYLGVDTARYMDSFTENTKIIGQIFGKEAEVDQALAKINEEIKQLHDKASASGKQALIILANDGKVSAYGPNSRFGILHDVFGFAPVDKNIEVSTHGQSISFEYIVEKDPDYLFVVDRGVVAGGQSSAKNVVENELVSKTKAYKDGHIVYLNPDFWYLSGGGLISVEEMVKEVEASLK